MRWRFVTIPGLLLCFAVVGLSEDNWPDWRGPQRNGVVTGETGLPTVWSTRENIHWKLDLPGRSGSTPVVWNDHILLNVTQGAQMELWAVNRRTGEVRWKRPLGGGNRAQRKANMSTPSDGARPLQDADDGEVYGGIASANCSQTHSQSL